VRCVLDVVLGQRDVVLSQRDTVLADLGSVFAFGGGLHGLAVGQLALAAHHVKIVFVGSLRDGGRVDPLRAGHGASLAGPTAQRWNVEGERLWSHYSPPAALEKGGDVAVVLHAPLLPGPDPLGTGQRVSPAGPCARPSGCRRAPCGG